MIRLLMFFTQLKKKIFPEGLNSIFDDLKQWCTTYGPRPARQLCLARQQVNADKHVRPAER